MSKLPTFRANRVTAYDSKYTGEEPVWDLQNTWSDEDFKKEYTRLFGFYGYYLSCKDLRPDVVKFMNANVSFSEAEKDTFATLPDWAVSATAGKLARSYNRGMDVNRVEKLTGTNVVQMVVGDIRNAIKNYGAEYAPKPQPVTEEDTSSKAVSIQDRIRTKVTSTLINDLDTLVNEWIKGGDKAESLKVADLVAKHELPAMGLKHFTEAVEKMKAEYEAARDKSYPEAVEGYSYLSRKGVLNRIQALQTMLDDVTKITHAKKATRKPRVKKPKSAEKQVSRLKYMQASAEYSLKSVSPLTIPTSYRVYIFNTKYRVLSCYECNSATGLEVKGSGIKNFSDTGSFSIRLRKPNDVLPDIISKTLKQIDKVTDTLKVKKTKPNGRLNDQCIILRTFANK